MNDVHFTDGYHPTQDWQCLTAPVAVLPIGSCEQHGSHMPLATDTVKAEYFAKHVAQSTGAGLLPALPIGQSYEHTGFRGTVSLRPETFMAVIRDIARELERQHFTRLVIINGHGGNYALPTVVRDINRADAGIRLILLNYWEFDRSAAGTRLREGEVHAGAWETSIMLAAFPDLVGDYRGATPPATEPDARQSDLNHLALGHLHPSGVWGDPSKASAEAGRTIIASIKENLVEAVQERLGWFERNESYAAPVPAAIRTMTARDLREGLRLCRVAGWNQCLEDWQLLFRLNPKGCFVAVENGQVVGTVMTAVYDGKLGWIAMVLVDPPFRGRGVGTRLLERAIESLSGCECIKLDATPEGNRVYEKLGFQNEYPLARMIAVCAPEVEAPSTCTARAMTPSDLDAVTALDGLAFGVERPEVIRGLLRMAPHSGAVALDGAGTIVGYVLGRPGRHYQQIGPIMAPDIQVAQALAASGFEKARGRPVALDVPLHDGPWLEWLRALGFDEQRPFSRMYRGANKQPGEPGRLFAIAGPELG